MVLARSVVFSFDLSLPGGLAVHFVQDVRRSLSRAEFLEDLRVSSGNPAMVMASIPVNASLFGERQLSFHSMVVPMPMGARLLPRVPQEYRLAWAEVAGDATVMPLPVGSRVDYRFDITIHLELPTPSRWGGKALTRMIEVTADRVLQTVSEGFPAALQSAAREAEAAYACT